MLTLDSLYLHAGPVCDRLAAGLREAVGQTLGRRGLCVGVSGGMDSALVLALSVKALGAKNVAALAMPERESAPESLELAKELAEALGVELIVEPISQILDAAGCYQRRDDAIRELVPEFGEGWGCKLALGNHGGYQITNVVVQPPQGESRTVRPTAEAYATIVAATNFKQRTRKMMEYYHADRLGFAVAGTPNLLEYDQGFFVKGGDGLADVKPICRLYKTQVYQLAAYMRVPKSICARPPATDAFSMPQSHEEFYFSLSYPQLDLCLYALDFGHSSAEVAALLDLPIPEIDRVFGIIKRKRAATAWLHMAPIAIEPR